VAQTLFILTRAVHFSACLLVLGTFAVDMFIVAPTGRSTRAVDGAWILILRRLLAAALPTAIVSGAAWFVFVAMEMSDLPFREAIRPQVLSLVWGQTQFGHLWQIRLVLWAATTALAVVAISRRNTLGRATAPALALSATLAASLAWAGHGQTNGPTSIHLAADIIHIVAGGFWPAGLVPLTMVLYSSRQFPGAQQGLSLSMIVRRFSAMSLAAVAILIASGLANSWFLLGPAANLYRTEYGVLLSAKIIVFVLMLMLGARNLLKWKPILTGDDFSDAAACAAAVRRLRFNVALETFLAAGVMLLVGGLGLAPPPAMEMPHAYHHHET
jgi:putative copper resistance protein D